MLVRIQFTNFFMRFDALATEALPIITAFGVSVIFCYLTRLLAIKFGILDAPNLPRKQHLRAVPLLGGLGIFLAFVGAIVADVFMGGEILRSGLPRAHLLALIGGSLILIVGGILDDRINLPPQIQIIFPIVAAGVVAFSGIGIKVLTNPLGGVIQIAPHFVFVLTGLWLVGMTYTTKLLDGVDGLATGIGAIGAIIIGLFALTDAYFQPDIARLAFLFGAVLAGFLVWNFWPAKMYLGEGGSTLVGFTLGVLAIISGSKIATALLVVGIPVLDVGAVILRRVFIERRSIFSGDRNHLHHRLMASGLSVRATVYIYYLLAAFFGIMTLLLQSRGKVFALTILALVMIVLLQIVKYYSRNEENKMPVGKATGEGE